MALWDCTAARTICDAQEVRLTSHLFKTILVLAWVSYEGTCFSLSSNFFGRYVLYFTFIELQERAAIPGQRSQFFVLPLEQQTGT
jgi:hypothetical protein